MKEHSFISPTFIRADVLDILSKKSARNGVSSESLSKRLHLPIKDIKRAIKELQKSGYNIVEVHGSYKLLRKTNPEVSPFNFEKLMPSKYTFGVISDTHLCSKYCRLDVLEAAYTYFSKQGITKVLHAGNIIDGENENNMFDLLAHGVHDQAQYLVDHYPEREGIVTYFITGECHEGWYQKREGIQIGWLLQHWAEERGRKDLQFIGHLERDITIKQPQGETIIRLIHPGGGSAYALSYPSQKMVESFQGGEKPHILIMGHHHKFELNYAREVTCLQPGCTQDQTPFERRRKIAAHVGFCTLELGCRIDGTAGQVTVSWFPFYDRKYHQNLELKI